MRAVFVVFLFAHAAVHGVMWSLPFTDAVDDMPFDPAESWLVGRRPVIGIGLAGLAAVGFVIAGPAFAVRATWWPVALGASAVVSLVLMGLFWSSYWIVGVVISAALVTSAWQADTPG
jgi:hypothetical protein